jgi:hypothetical protein|tara:strand:+ start:246 stop:917 length:672 start_codon:yes stop_codon:yes gene_type:complete
LINFKYVDIVSKKPWNKVKEVFKYTPRIYVPCFTNLSIHPEDWVKFSVDNIDLAKQQWYDVKSHYTGPANALARVLNDLGRDEGNTTNINYGTEGNTNDMLLELLGEDNISNLGLLKDTILIKLLVKMPGHGFPWHFDDAASYSTHFPELEVDEDKNCNLGKVVRYWFPVSDWSDGHVLQISDTMLHHWNAGDTYILPWGQGHASSNFGYTPMYTVSLTGVVI